MIQQLGTFLSSNIFDLFCILYAYDGAFVFEYRNDTKIGITLLYDQFSCIVLEMHIGTETNTSNTKWVFFPPPDFFKAETLPLNDLTNSTKDLQKKESEKKIHRREDKEYTKCR